MSEIKSFVSKTGLSYFFNRIKVLFAGKSEFDTLSQRVNDIIAEGGEPNVIETVKVNGTALTPDAQKAVNIEAARMSASRNNGELKSMNISQGDNWLGITDDGYVGFKDDLSRIDMQLATRGYVDEHGGKIDKILVNGTEQTITSKAVDIAVPTKLSELTNDGDGTTGSKFPTAAEMKAAISTAVAAVYRYKGSVATVDDLPATGNTAGDVYDVQATGTNYSWTGTAWDELGQLIDTSLLWAKSELTAITTAEIDAIIDGN